MNKPSIFTETKGTGKVFRFTFAQIMKSKANLIGLLIFFAIAFFSIPVSSVMGGSDMMEDDTVAVEEEGYYSETQLDYLKDKGVDEAVLGILGSSMDSDAGSTVSDYLDEDELSMSSYSVQLGYIIIVFMCCVLSISSIIRIVIEEKASKLVDLLMVSVKPLALLYGKVLAELVYMLVTLLVTVAGLALSNILFSSKYGSGFMGNLFANGVHLSAHSAYVAVVILVTALLGMLVFGLLSGLCGAGCSTIEESNSAMGASMILIFIGYFAAVIFLVAGGQTLMTIMSIVPPFSIFLMPTRVMIGKLGFGFVLLSWLCLVICIVLLLKLAASVYRGLIIYNGSPKKFRQILKMARKGEA